MVCMMDTFTLTHFLCHSAVPCDPSTESSCSNSLHYTPDCIIRWEIFFLFFFFFFTLIKVTVKPVLASQNAFVRLSCWRKATSCSAKVHANTLQASDSDGRAGIRKRTCNTGAELTAIRASRGRTHTHTRTLTQWYAPVLRYLRCRISVRHIACLRTLTSKTNIMAIFMTWK